MFSFLYTHICKKTHKVLCYGFQSFCYELFIIGPEHIPKYHEWMKDPNLLEATGSEPLSYEEEVKMQQSWRDDPKKCTFIVHTNNDTNDEKVPVVEESADSTSFSVTENLQHMIGDVNLFLSEIDVESEDGTDDDGHPSSASLSGPAAAAAIPSLQAEIDIMIAETGQRRQGLGTAAVCAMLLYGAKELNIRRFFCKINEDNVSSIKLFTSLGFTQCDYAACFKQVELELMKSANELEVSLGPHGNYKQISCPK